MIDLSTFARVARSVHLDELADPQHDEAAAPPPYEPSSAASDGMAALRALIDTAAVPPPAPAEPDAGAQQREDAARRLKQEGLASAAPNPPPTQEELDALAARISAADDDAAVAIARDPRAMAIATPQQKAALIRELSAGHTNSDEEAAIKQILLSCTSKEEMEQVVQMSGGIEAIADELDGGDLQAVIDHANQLAQTEERAAVQAIDLLEQAQSPEEFKRLYEELGGDSLKYKLPRPRPGSTQTTQGHVDLLGRVEELGRKYGVAGVGFGMPPEKTAALQAAIQKAIDAEDCDAIVQLADNSDAMRVASPAQKARMVKVLQDGWTKDSQDMAIARILTSCDSKAEFDQVVDMAGGREILEDIDFEEAKVDINKLMGGFDRLDCADDKATAEQYRGMLMPPQIDRLSATREPSDAELRAVLGPDALPQGDDTDPSVRAARQRFDEIRARMGRAAHDIDADPMARNKLALVNRQRELAGQPPLDYTTLVTQAYQAANDPGVDAEVNRAIADAERQLGPLGAETRQEIREKVLGQRLGAIAKQYGLSEQEMKTLVTAKMGRVLQQGAQAVAAAGRDVIATLQAQLAEVERTEGHDSPEARRLRESMGKVARGAQAWAAHLQVTGATAASLFKVPPSFAEEFVKAISVVGDVLAAVVNVIPGVGQAISGAYFGVKAIVAAASGDVLGAFKSLLSAVPGVSGVFGAASAAINTGVKVAQAGIAAGEAVANGDPLAVLGAVGGMAGNLGFDAGQFIPGGDAVRGVIDGVVRGDAGTVLDGLGGASGAFGELGALGQRVGEGFEFARGGMAMFDAAGNATLPALLRAGGADALADAVETIGASPAARGVRQTVDVVARFVDAAGRNDADGVGEVLRSWMPELAAHGASKSIARLADQARQVLRSPAWFEARNSAGDAVRLAEQQLQRMAQLKPAAGVMREFEEMARPFAARVDGRWAAAGAELLRQLELRRGAQN